MQIATGLVFTTCLIVLSGPWPNAVSTGGCERGICSGSSQPVPSQKLSTVSDLNQLCTLSLLCHQFFYRIVMCTQRFKISDMKSSSPHC